MNDFLSLVQANSFVASLFVGGVVACVSTFLKFRSMQDKIHSLSKRLSIIEETRIIHIETTVAEQANLLSAINATVSSMNTQLAAISAHLLGKSK